MRAALSVMMSVVATLCVGAGALAGCSDPVTGADAAVAADAVVIAADGGPGDAASDGGIGDAGPAPLACACDPDEACSACITLIGRCCYEDETFGGTFEYILDNCQSDPSCKSCCNECAALSCDEIKARGSCPNLLGP